ncbi:sensor domain-containing diguanylate cyclase [Veronia pacifica]|nr:sensor domain-containing diguanylate cyclase [Veronia pacifica]
MIVGITYYNYKNAINSLVVSSMHTKESSIVYLTSYISDAVMGSNYARLLLPSFKSDLSQQNGLKYILVSGKSSFTHQPISVAYLKSEDLLWRVDYPDDFLENLNRRQAKLEQKKAEPGADMVKINYLIERFEDARLQYQDSLFFNQQYLQNLEHFRQKGENHVDLDRGLLYIRFLLKNGYAGQAELLFDISDIAKLKILFIEDSVREFLVTVVLSIPVLMFLSFSISVPLKELAKHMRSSVEELDQQATPGIRRKDEIGDLARQFTKLVDSVVLKNKELDDLSRRDPLTGLLNRRSLTKQLQTLNEDFPDKILFGFYIDIDHFKAYNDTYGHIYGDNTLVLVAGEIDSFAREHSGFAFRLGGEEFMLLLASKDQDIAFNQAQGLCQRIENMAIEHAKGTSAKCVTVSIGIAGCCDQIINEDTTQGIIVRADEALYSAKELGRNLVQIYSGDNHCQLSR